MKFIKKIQSSRDENCSAFTGVLKTAQLINANIINTYKCEKSDKTSQVEISR